jgi:hypothetical protein
MPMPPASSSPGRRGSSPSIAVHSPTQEREVAALAPLARTSEPLPRAVHVVRRTRRHEAAQGLDMVCAPRQPPTRAFAGIWTPWNGTRATKANPVVGEHQLFGLLTREANAEVSAIHPKAMPVILTTEAEIEHWMTALARRH